MTPTPKTSLPTIPDVAAYEQALSHLEQALAALPAEPQLPEAPTRERPEQIVASWPIKTEADAEAWAQEWLRCDEAEAKVDAMAKQWKAAIERRRVQLAYAAGGYVHKYGTKQKVRLGTVEEWARAHLLPRCKYAQTMGARFSFRAAAASLSVPEERVEDLLAWIAENNHLHLRRVTVEPRLDEIRKHIEATGEVPTMQTEHGPVALVEYHAKGRYDEFTVGVAKGHASPFKDDDTPEAT